MTRTIRDSIRRVDAVDKASGQTKYIGDMEFEDLIYGRLVRATRSHAIITQMTVPPLPEGYYFVTKDDIPQGGKNEIQQIGTDWPVFVDTEVSFYGETIGMVVGEDKETVLKIASSIEVEYEDLPAVFDIDDALAMKTGLVAGENNTFADYTLCKGDVQSGWEKAVTTITDEVKTGFQEHVYMETQGLVASYEDGRYTITASCQCPFYLRKAVANVLNVPKDDIIVRQAVTGGAFGGKEHFPDIIAAPLVVAARVARRPIQVIFDRHEDMSFTAKRHPSIGRFKTGLDKEGNVVAMEVDVTINAGAYMSCSNIVLQRAIFSIISVYDFPNVKVRGRSVATNAFPSDAFRGFGAPQGIFLAEMHVSHIARHLGIDPVEYKQRYFVKQHDRTITNGTIYEEVKLPQMLQKVAEASDLEAKRKSYQKGSLKGIGISFYLHGAGFTGNGEQEIIKAKLRMRKNADQTVDILLSNVEMGQGLQTTFPKIASAVLDIPISRIRCDNPDTSIVPDSGPTVASRSLMVVGKLVERASYKLKERMQESGVVEVEVAYEHPEGLSWNQQTLQGDAYPSFGWGVCVVEVEIDRATYEVETKGIWTVHDIGVPIDELIVHGQVNGGVIQSLGYGALEKLEYKDGKFYQNTLADYIIPTSMDFPMMTSELVENPYENGPFGAKGLGELVFDGAAAAYADAVQWALDADLHSIPVTPEYIMEVLSRG